MKIPFDNLKFPNSRNKLCSILIKKRKEKKERKTKKVLIGSLGKCIASLSVELSSCYLLFSGMCQDKIPPPDQVRSTQSRPGPWAGPALQVEQSSTCPSLLLSPWYSRHQDEWRGHYQTLDHNMNPCELPFVSSVASSCSQTVQAFQNCWEKR